MKEFNDKQLLARIYALADKDAFVILHDRYAKKIKRFLLYKLPTESDVEDELNNIFLRAWTYMTTAQVESASGLLYKIARNRVADFYRSRSDQQPLEIDEQVIEIASDEGSGAEQMEVSAEMRVMEAHLKKINPSYQELIIMRYFDNMSISEMAEFLDKTENNVRVTLFRAIQALKKIIEEK